MPKGKTRTRFRLLTPMGHHCARGRGVSLWARGLSRTGTGATKNGCGGGGGIRASELESPALCSLFRGTRVLPVGTAKKEFLSGAFFPALFLGLGAWWYRGERRGELGPVSLGGFVVGQQGGPGARSRLLKTTLCCYSSIRPQSFSRSGGGTDRELVHQASSLGPLACLPFLVERSFSWPL